MERNAELEKKLREKFLKDGIADEETVDAIVNIALKSCPQELMQNVWEWVEEKEEYTDIKCCGLSVNDLFNHGYDRKSFFRVMRVLNDIKINRNGKWDWSIIGLYYRTCPIIF